MGKNERIKNAQEIALDRGIDYILEVRPAPDFVEVVGSMGGDTVTYRVYDNGRVCER